MILNNKYGSAFLMVLGAVGVLIIITFSLLKTNTNKSYSTRFMSNEKKAEAVAEAAADFTLAYIKQNMNNSAPGMGKQFYDVLRMPAKLKTGQLVEVASGKNASIDVTTIPNVPEFDKIAFVDLFKPMQEMIGELGDANVTLTVNCKIINAEAFCSDSYYEVVGITKKSCRAKGLSSQVYDDVEVSSAETDGRLNGSGAPWAPSQWNLTFNFPNLGVTDSKQVKVDLPWPFGSITITIHMRRIGLTGLKWAVNESIATPAEIVGDPDVTETIQGGNTIDMGGAIKSFLGDQITELSMKGVRKMAMDNSDAAVSGNAYKAEKLKAAIGLEYGTVQGSLGAGVAVDSFGGNANVVEKGGVMEVVTVVTYTPNGPSGIKIVKTLVSHIPFKVSDIQPIAPEYTFFVANSDRITEGPVPSSLGGDINLTSGSGDMIIHNVPDGNYKSLTGLTYGSGVQVPGMVRLNADGKLTTINSFLGTPSEPQLTELGIVTCPKVIPNMKNIPVWQWSGSAMTPDHMLDFPVLFDADPGMNPISPIGLKGVLTFFEKAAVDMLESPTLLFGTCHIEYPLGIRLEAPLDMFYAHAEITVKPEAAFPPVTDLTEIFVDYSKKEIPYGMVGFPAYTDYNDWNTSDWDNMPANCYSLIQYAKKATSFYNTGADFLNDPKRNSGGVTDISGVIYIKDELEITSELKLQGNGMIVTKGDIVLNKNVTRVGDSVVSLIARGGRIHFKSGCSEVHASCFSNGYPIAPGKVAIYGNLVCNKFQRNKVVDFEVFYDSKACRTSPLSVMRDVGKFAPSRYYVSMADNWSKYEYEKK